jgi:hypothetical protein
MDHAARLRAARQRLALDLAQALGNLPPDIAESALGRAVAAEALIGEAVALIAADSDWPTARAIVTGIVAATGPDGPARR